jgi:hypothetical protein
MVDDRLHDDRLEARVEKPLPVGGMGVAGQREGGGLAMTRHRSDRAKALESVDRPHADVEHEEIRFGDVDGRHRLRGREIRKDLVPRLEQDRQGMEIVSVVLDEQ